MKNKILHLELNHGNSGETFNLVTNSGDVLSSVCQNLTLKFLDANKLDLFSRVTKKRLVAMLKKACKSDYQHVIDDLTLTPNQKLATKGDIADINKAIKKYCLVDICKEVYEKLRDRDINPSGRFDSGGRWYADNDQLISSRSPSRAWPYSQMTACRTLKYVKKVALYYNCKSAADLEMHV